MAEIDVFVCQGCQQGENYRKLPKIGLGNTRKRPKSGGSWQTSVAEERCFWGEVYDFGDPYWRVRFPDGDWKELNRHEVKQGKELATASA